MTVQSEVNKSPTYIGNDSTRVFAYPFKIISADHISVVMLDTLGQEVVAGPYTVDGVGNENGGSVTLSGALPTNFKLTIIRDVPFTQETSLPNGGPYFAQTVEKTFDLDVMRAQQLREENDRSLKVSPGQVVPSIDQIASAQSWAELALAAKIAAEQAAQNAVTQGFVPIFPSISNASGLTLPQWMGSIRVNGLTAAGDGGGGLYVRATAQPTGEYAGLAFRSADRFLPDGATSSANGGWWAWKEKFSCREIMPKLASMLANGRNVLIGCYGDSQTDGNGTSARTPNPQDAIGSTDHNIEAPNAWPNRLRFTLSYFYPDASFKIMNHGFSGKSMFNGWAFNNIQAAVISNAITFAGRLHDAVIIQFGSNDIESLAADPAGTVAAFSSETRKVCRLLMSLGIVPILQTCDPNATSDPAARDSWKTTEVLDTLKRQIADELGIALIDTGADLRRWINNNKEGHSYILDQYDTLHGGDAWHAFKGSSVARFFMRDYLTRPGAIGPQYVSPSDSGMKNSLPSTTRIAIAQARAGEVYSSGSPGAVVPSGFAAQLWVWNEDPDAEIFYRGVGDEGVTSANLATYDLPDHSIYEFPNMLSRGPRGQSGIGFSTGTHGARVDVPYRIGKLAYGMNLIRHAVKNRPIYFVGSYEIRSTQDWAIEQTGDPTDRAYSIQVNALRDCGALCAEIDKTFVGVTTVFAPEAPDLSNAIGLMRGDLARLYLRAVMPVNTGVILGWTKSFITRPGGNRENKSFLLLYRSATNTIGLFLGTVNEGVVSFTSLISGTIAQTADADGAFKFIVTLGYNVTNNNFESRVFEGWDYGPTAIIASSIAPGNLAPPSGFVMGGLFANNPSATSGFYNARILDYFGKQLTSQPGKAEPVTVAP